MSDLRLLKGDSTSLPQGQVIKGGNVRATYTVTQSYTAAPIANVSGFGSYAAYDFQADSLPGWSAWASVFDRYRIRHVEVSFTPSFNQENVASNVQIPMFHTVVDFDDAAVPSSITALQSFSTYAGVIGNKSIRRVFVPRSSVSQYVSALVTGYAEGDPSQWRDVAYGDIPHYGLKCGFDGPATAGGTCTYTVLVKLTVEFGGQRG